MEIQLDIFALPASSISFSAGKNPIPLPRSTSITVQMDRSCVSTYSSHCRHFPSPLAFLLFIVLVQFTQISFTSSSAIILSPPRALFLHPTYGIRDIECLFQCSDPRASTLRTT